MSTHGSRFIHVLPEEQVGQLFPNFNSFQASVLFLHPPKMSENRGLHGVYKSNIGLKCINHKKVAVRRYSSK